MKIEKSTRHSKIIGEFGEAFLANMLSRSGFEVTRADHTGLDLIAYHRATRKRLGITVKSRTRTSGQENVSVNIFSSQKAVADKAKLRDACEALGCDPWIAVYVEKATEAHLFLTSLANYEQRYCSKRQRVIDTWKMGKKDLATYAGDAGVFHVQVAFEGTNWTWAPLPPCVSAAPASEAPKSGDS
jgi:hypothetical protein